MTRSPQERAESAIIHELAGLVASIWGFSEIVEKVPDHPERESFISVLHGEARRAARAMKDLQLLRWLDEDRVPENVGAIRLAELEGELATWIDRRDAAPRLLRPLAAPTPSVRADAALLASMLGRSVEAMIAAFGEDFVEVSVEREADRVRVSVSTGASGAEDELRDGLSRGEGRMRVLYLARRLLPRWGGAVFAGRAGARRLVTFELMAAPPETIP